MSLSDWHFDPLDSRYKWVIASKSPSMHKTQLKPFKRRQAIRDRRGLQHKRQSDQTTSFKIGQKFSIGAKNVFLKCSKKVALTKVGKEVQS